MYLFVGFAADMAGETQFQTLFTDQSGATNTGEYIVVDRAQGGFGIYMDTQSWGSPATGGNFGIMHVGALSLST